MAVASRLIEAYRSWVSQSKSPLTANAYIADVKRFLSFVGKDVERVTVLDVSLYFDELRKQGIKPRSLNRYSWALRSFFEAVGKTDVARLIPTPVYESPLPRWLETGTVRRILECAPDGMPKAMLTLAYDVALRQGEVPLLNRDWFYPESRSIRVRRLKHRGASPAESILPVSNETASLLEEYLEGRDDGERAMFAVSGGRYGRGLRRISSDAVNYVYRKAAEDAGVDPNEYSFHSFSRHSRATHMAVEMLESSGVVDVVKLSKFLGHASVNSTLLYVHLATAYLAERRRLSSDFRMMPALT